MSYTAFQTLNEFYIRWVTGRLGRQTDQYITLVVFLPPLENWGTFWLNTVPRNIGFVAQMHPQSQGYLSFIVPTLEIGFFHTLKFPASPHAALALVILRPVWRPYHAFNRFMNY